MDNKKVPKSSKFFFCEKCNYTSSRYSQYERHLMTAKHKKITNDNKNVPNNEYYACEICNKSYLYLSGLSRHKKKCNFIEIEKNDISDNQLTLSNDVILKLINDNKELKNIIVEQQIQMGKQQEQISELIPRLGNNNNTQNNKFNINVFLNEKCKDAINMTDFIKSIQVSIEQLDFTKQNGLANGLSKTIMDNMNKLSLYERPLHCTDVKRETLYIKDENEWSKDNS